MEEKIQDSAFCLIPDDREEIGILDVVTDTEVLMKRAVSSSPPPRLSHSSHLSIYQRKRKEKKEKEGIGIPGCAGAKAPAY